MRRKLLWGARLEAYLSTHAFEILFVSMYGISMALMFIWGAHDEWHHIRKTVEPKHPTWTAFKWYIAIARGAGYTLNLNCALIIILASRLFVTSIRETPLQKVLPLDKSFPDAHIIVGYGILVGVCIHVPFHFLWLFSFNQFDKFELWSFSMSVAMGVPLLSIFLVMFVTALPKYRRKHFHRFYLIHLIGAAFFFVLVALHGMYRKKPETAKWIFPAVLIYVIDRIVRRMSVHDCTILLDANNTSVKSGKVLELRVPKPFEYRAGQYCEIYIRGIGSLKEWHPFTIASSPHEKTMCFYIKAAGDWTNTLFDKFENKESIHVRVRGPYGAPAQHAGQYPRVVLISGGIGSTPFASISKHLHHESTTNIPEHAIHYKREAGESENFEDKLLRTRVGKTVTAFFGFGIDGEPLDEVEQEDQAQYVAETLKLGFFQAADDISSKSSVSGPTPRNDIETGQDRFVHMRRFPGIRTIPARLLAFLHSTRVQLTLMISLLVRISMVCIVAIWRQARFGYSTTLVKPGAYWSILVDVVLSIALIAVMAVTFALEIGYMRWKFFFSSGRVLDFCAFLPVSALSIYASIMTYKASTAHSAMTIQHFAILIPLQFILLSSRMYRSIGSRTLRDTNKPECGCRCAEKVPNVDFVWTTPYSKDDEWLRNELAPLATGSELRLHRYVTREEEVDIEGLDEHINTAAGRPQWQSLFARIADSTRSNSDVGVFFCGPPAMGTAVRRALRKVEVRANIRGSYLSSLTDKQVQSDFSVKNKSDLSKLRKFGCNVRFVFREENF